MISLIYANVQVNPFLFSQYWIRYVACIQGSDGFALLFHM